MMSGPTYETPAEIRMVRVMGVNTLVCLQFQKL